MIEVAIRDELIQIRILLERLLWVIDGPPDVPSKFTSATSPQRGRAWRRRLDEEAG